MLMSFKFDENNMIFNIVFGKCFKSFVNEFLNNKLRVSLYKLRNMIDFLL